jgi:O-antigen ligase
MAGKLGTVRQSATGLGGLGIPLGLLVAAVLLGSLVAVGETIALAVGLALLASAFIVRDFRVGVVLLIMLFPVSASPYIPRSIAGITGLNPLNLLLMATLGSLLIAGLAHTTWRRIAPPQLLLLYIAPLVLAALLGMRHVSEIPPDFAEADVIQFNSAGSYLRDQLVKPLFLVVFAVLVGAAAARWRRVEYFIVPLMFAVAISALMTFYFIAASGIGMHELASDDARAFMTPMGMHANDRGRLYATAYAMMLFTCVETPDRRLRIALIATMVLLAVALILTFSRSAMLGFALVSVWFVLTRRNPAMLILAALAMAAMLAMLPDAIYERLSYGSNEGANAISAGRLDMIWQPLLPELANNPLFGNGIGSTMWMEPMRMGEMLMVTHPHNAYLQALLDLGAVGALLVCGFFVHVWLGFRQLAKDPTADPVARGFFKGALIGLIVFMIAGISGSSLEPTLEQVFLWLAIGMMYGFRQAPAGKAP